MKRFALILLCLLPCTLLRGQGRAIEQYASGSNDKQWALLHIDPPDAIVTLDSTDVRMTRNGTVQAFLPVGKHSFVVESPFYHSYTSQFELTDSVKVILDIRLTPAFGYASVHTPLKDGMVFIDGIFSGKENTGLCKLSEGPHRLRIIRDSLKYYDGIFQLESGAKKWLDITEYTITPASRREMTVARMAQAGLAGADADEEAAADENQWGMLSIHANVAGATVLVNGVEYGQSPCIVKGLKPSVRYRITVRMDGWREQTRMVSVKSGEMPELEFTLKKK